MFDMELFYECLWERVQENHRHLNKMSSEERSVQLLMAEMSLVINDYLKTQDTMNTKDCTQ